MKTTKIIIARSEFHNREIALIGKITSPILPYVTLSKGQQEKGQQACCGITDCKCPVTYQIQTGSKVEINEVYRDGTVEFYHESFRQVQE